MAKSYFKDWPAFEGHLQALGFFHMELGLERIGAVLEALGLRQLPCPSVQVAGTNGKGSTSTFLASLARAHGKKAMLHSSPHFVSLRERVRVFEPGGSNWGELLPEGRWLAAANAVMAAGGDKLTYFELITAMAAWLMREEGAELAILESGLGGRWDATTAMEADISAFTPIGLDHCAVLGGSIAEIATDKAGAMREGRRAVSATQVPAARKVLQDAAREKGATLIFSSPAELPDKFAPSADPYGLTLGIKGAHQAENAALALKLWRLIAQDFGLEPNAAAEERGLMEARLPGRMQFIQPAPGDVLGLPLPHPALVIDGAHNAHGLAALGHSLARLKIAPAAIIFNCMADKNPEELIPHLRVLSTGQIIVPEIKDNPRAMPAAELAALIGLAATPVPSLSAALQMAYASISERLPEELLPDKRNQDIHEHRHPLLICGSLYLLGEFFTLYPQYLAKDSA